ncbi:VOC family protein [Ferrovibrio sp.]|uniref:bleomycin resistance protein n=1 Tax=Ferrovibrio sp. TaxID=1917215 RepID=UPI00311DB438
MTDHDGAPPRSGWARLVPELLVRDPARSLEFWCGLLGFRIAYSRDAEGFAYLERPDGAQIMLCRRNGSWETGRLDLPYGRGVMFQIYVDDLDAVQVPLRAAGWALHAGPREVWRRVGPQEAGQREIFVQDPDGYLIMVAQDIGTRPAV